MSTPASAAEIRDGFVFRGGHPLLDLTATLKGRLKDSQRELLEAREDLVRWLVAAGFECEAAPDDDVALGLAHQLREAIYQSVTSLFAGGVLPATARRRLNRIAGLPPAAPQIGTDGVARVRGKPTELLSFLAREAVLLIGGESKERLRQCEGEGCAVLFLDASRSGDRRWCSMAACGNRQKVAAFRKRNRED